MEESWYERHERSVEGQLSGLNGQIFLRHRLENPQETGNLADKVRDLVAESGMSVSAAKGFFDYMKIRIEECSHINGVEK